MKILAIDFNSLMNRSFFAIRTLTTKDGTPTNALTGFAKTYCKLRDTFSPDVIVAAFDVHAPTFRHELFSDYKGTRSGTPEELLTQMPLGQEFVRLMGGVVIGIAGYEADDLLGTVSRWAESNGHTCIIATGDRDSLQLVTESTTVNLASNKGDIRFTPAEVFEKYGVTPKELIEVKALMGDSSDNIPGVKGIGEKTALGLISQYHSLDYMLSHLDELAVTPRIRALIDEHRDMALLSRTLGEINCEVPLPASPADWATCTMDVPALTEFLTKYELTSVLHSLKLEPVNAPAPAASVPTPDALYELIEDPDPAWAAEQINAYGKCCFLAEIVGQETKSLTVLLSEGKLARFTESANEAFALLIEQSKLPKITFDAKPVYKLGFAHGVELDPLITDLKLAAYLLSSSEKNYALPEIRESYLPDFRAGLDGICTDVAALPKLDAVLREIFREREMTFLFTEIELPLCRVLASMETEGFTVDRESLRAFGEQLTERIAQHKANVLSLAGTEFNLNSTQHLADVLFNKLGLPPKKKTKSGYSTDAEVLESLRPLHPIIDEILEYRKLTKLHSTYVVGLDKCIGDDGRVRSTFNQTETRTGRISSLEPNVQNIPVRTPLGAEMRKFFVAKEGCTLVDADYSQIELRILAHISNDEKMIAGFKDGADIHRSTASQVFHVPFDEVPASLRSQAKAINFGIVYGISAFSLSQDIHVSMSEAKQYIDNYLSTYSGVSAYMKRSVELAREQGYVETMYHRPRQLPDIHSKRPPLRSFSERVAMNMPIQGTAADIIKLAMNRVYERLKREGLSAKLILQVHDELLIECPIEETEPVSRIVREEMEQAASLSVALEVDLHTGENWYLAKG